MKYPSLVSFIVSQLNTIATKKPYRASLNTAEDAEKHEELLPLPCFQMAVDLVDTIKIIDIVLDEKEHNYGIPNAFGHAMVAIACISFLLSLWKMLEIDLNTGEQMPKRACVSRENTNVSNLAVQVPVVQMMDRVIQLINTAKTYCPIRSLINKGQINCP